MGAFLLLAAQQKIPDGEFFDGRFSEGGREIFRLASGLSKHDAPKISCEFGQRTNGFLETDAVPSDCLPKQDPRSVATDNNKIHDKKIHNDENAFFNKNDVEVKK